VFFVSTAVVGIFAWVIFLVSFDLKPKPEKKEKVEDDNEEKVLNKTELVGSDTMVED
jgi:hypothetical protein